MSHQPIYLDTVTNSRQHDSRHEVHDLDRLLVDQVGHLLLGSQVTPGRIEAHADQVGAHVLGAAGAQNVILAVLNQAELPCIVHQTDLQSHIFPNSLV